MGGHFSDIFTSKLVGASKKKESDELWVKEILKELELIVDSTEQDRERPENHEKQKKSYSGKQKNHTFKNQIIITEKGEEIVDVIVGKRSPESEINLFKKPQKKFDKEQKFQGDKGDQGGERVETPKKKKRNQKMSEEAKKENQQKAQKRIFVEHVIRLIKIFGWGTRKIQIKRI